MFFVSCWKKCCKKKKNNKVVPKITKSNEKTAELKIDIKQNGNKNGSTKKFLGEQAVVLKYDDRSLSPKSQDEYSKLENERYFVMHGYTLSEREEVRKNSLKTEIKGQKTTSSECGMSVIKNK